MSGSGRVFLCSECVYRGAVAEFPCSSFEVARLQEARELCKGKSFKQRKWSKGAKSPVMYFDLESEPMWGRPRLAIQFGEDKRTPIEKFQSYLDDLSETMEKFYSDLVQDREELRQPKIVTKEVTNLDEAVLALLEMINHGWISPDRWKTVSGVVVWPNKSIIYETTVPGLVVIKDVERHEVFGALTDDSPLGVAITEVLNGLDEKTVLLERPGQTRIDENGFKSVGNDSNYVVIRNGNL